MGGLIGIGLAAWTVDVPVSLGWDEIYYIAQAALICTLPGFMIVGGAVGLGLACRSLEE
mgnify:CR=1 FL=1